EGRPRGVPPRRARDRQPEDAASDPHEETAYNSARMSQLFRRKPVGDLVSEGTSSLKRTLGPIQLTALGVGAIIGAGIFSTVGTAAAGRAEPNTAPARGNPSVALSRAWCRLPPPCFAPLSAAMVPIAGPAYTYSYATLGELVAWIIGWDLIIEYAIGNVAVAISWSGYFQELLNGFGLHIPAWLGVDYRTAAQAAAKMAEAAAAGTNTATLGASVVQAGSAVSSAPHLLGIPIVFNLPAFLIVALVTVVLVKGVNESAWTNTAMVALKIVIIVFFLAMGAFYVKPENWHPFAPNGFAGVSSAAAIIFFAYIGFDAVSTAAEEARNTKRDMPIGIIPRLIQWHH